MRHDLLPLAVAPSPPGMREAARSSALVAPPRRTQRSAPRFAAACAGAIALTTVAAAAHQHLGLAARTREHPPGATQGARPPAAAIDTLAPKLHSARRSRCAEALDETRPPVQYCACTCGQHGGARRPVNNLPVVTVAAPVLIPQGSSLSTAHPVGHARPIPTYPLRRKSTPVATARCT